MQQLIEELAAAHAGDLLPDEPLAPYTTWKIGGPVDLLIVPHDKRQLSSAVRILNRYGVTWMTLGRGSNLLVSDRGIRGAVIRLGSGMDTALFDGNLITAGGACSLIRLSSMAGRHGLTGLEFAGGIPGTVGGAVYMNAGAHGSDVSRILLSAEVMLDTGELVNLNNRDLQFGYRHSILQEQKGIVTEAVLGLQFGDRKEIAAAMAAYKDRRLRTQPLQLPCAGSVFRNPEGHHAAGLIEQAGLKGTRIGGAEVSMLHANFIINTGDATAEDVLALIEHIRTIVEDRFGVRLVTEVKLEGER